MIRSARCYSEHTEQMHRTIVYRCHWNWLQRGTEALRDAVLKAEIQTPVPGSIAPTLAYWYDMRPGFRYEINMLFEGYDFMATIGNIGYRPYGLRVMKDRNFIVRRHHCMDPAPAHMIARIHMGNHDLVLYVR
jgi:hypothetical protein